MNGRQPSMILDNQEKIKIGFLNRKILRTFKNLYFWNEGQRKSLYSVSRFYDKKYIKKSRGSRTDLQYRY